MDGAWDGALRDVMPGMDQAPSKEGDDECCVRDFNRIPTRVCPGGPAATHAAALKIKQ